MSFPHTPMVQSILVVCLSLLLGAINPIALIQMAAECALAFPDCSYARWVSMSQGFLAHLQSELSPAEALVPAVNQAVLGPVEILDSTVLRYR